MFACPLALWNERDPFLKERLFGLANEEGNHGEDVKEYYYYLDGVPSHAFMRMLYKYPQVEYPYDLLYQENRLRDRAEPEFELIDALEGAFAEGRYFDVIVDYAKADEDDILWRITAYNRGPEPASLHILPQLWYRNTWSWGHHPARPVLEAIGPTVIRSEHRHLGERFWYLDIDPHTPALLFTENETNFERLFGVPNAGLFVKDAFHEAIVGRRPGKVNPAGRGTKAAAHYHATIKPGAVSRCARASATPRSITPLATSMRSSSGASPRPTNTIDPSNLPGSTRMSGGFSTRRLRACSGPSSFITTARRSGSMAIPRARSRRRLAGGAQCRVAARLQPRRAERA